MDISPERNALEGARLRKLTTPTHRTNPNDPKGLIRESYRIDGIGEAECRSILVDWALSLPEGVTARDALAALIVVFMLRHR